MSGILSALGLGGAPTTFADQKQCKFIPSQGACRGSGCQWTKRGQCRMFPKGRPFGRPKPRKSAFRRSNCAKIPIGECAGQSVCSLVKFANGGMMCRAKPMKRRRRRRRVVRKTRAAPKRRRRRRAAPKRRRKLVPRSKRKRCPPRRKIKKRKRKIYKGPRGGCYYKTSSGHKVYV